MTLPAILMGMEKWLPLLLNGPAAAREELLAGYTADVMSDRGKIGENVQFLQKPFSMQSLAEKVRDAL